MFTQDSTILEIISDQSVKKSLGSFGIGGFIELLPEKDRERSLKDLAENVKTPWGLPYPSDIILRAANQAVSMDIDKVWKSMALWSVADPLITLDTKKSGLSCVCLQIREDTPELMPRVPKAKSAEHTAAGAGRTGKKRPAVIICPGGGYKSSVSYSEGMDFAEKMAEAGYSPFVLNYRVEPNRYPAPDIDLTLAIKYVRANADAFGIDPDDLMIMGSSAGGHLVGMQGVNCEKYDELLMRELKEMSPALAASYEGISARPDKICMNYPLVSFAGKKWTPGVSSETYVGKTEEELKETSLEYYDLHSFPRTYMWICEDDGLINVSDVIKVADMLKESEAGSLFHLFPAGDHGCGRAIGTSAEGWMDEMMEFMK